jgi:flagellar hook-basal body complex protein FliE
MSSFVPPIAAIGAMPPSEAVSAISLGLHAQPVANMSFGQLMTAGINHVETKIARADELANAFALDDKIPVHQVTFALEDARLSLELMMQVRGRMVEAYQQLMGMQL